MGRRQWSVLQTKHRSWHQLPINLRVTEWIITLRPSRFTTLLLSIIGLLVDTFVLFLFIKLNKGLYYFFYVAVVTLVLDIRLHSPPFAYTLEERTVEFDSKEIIKYRSTCFEDRLSVPCCMMYVMNVCYASCCVCDESCNAVINVPDCVSWLMLQLNLRPDNGR